jgi:hypothetical protein
MSTSETIRATDDNTRKRLLIAAMSIFNRRSKRSSWPRDMLNYFCLSLAFPTTRDVAVEIITVPWAKNISPEDSQVVYEAIFRCLLTADSLFVTKLKTVVGYLGANLQAAWNLMKRESIDFVKGLTRNPPTQYFIQDSAEEQSTERLAQEETSALDDTFKRLSTLLEYFEVSNFEDDQVSANRTIFTEILFLLLSAVNALSSEEGTHRNMLQ